MELLSLFQEMPWIVAGFGDRHELDWPETTKCTTIRQIHSNVVLEAEHPGLAGEGDGLITDRPGLMLCIRTADCVPILLADPGTRSVAAVHAGWRGTVAGILEMAIRQMGDRYGAIAGDLRIMLGPAIGRCCFEVGPEVAAEFRPLFPEREDLNQRTHVDLVEANIRQAMRVGVRRENLGSTGGCTSCQPERYFSFRREREQAGRMVSAIGIRE